MEIPLINIDNKKELTEKINLIEINYGEMKESILNILNTNNIIQEKRRLLYDNKFILDNEKRDLNSHNTYFDIIESTYMDCEDEFQMTKSQFLQKIITNNFSSFTLVNKNINIEFALKFTSFNEIRKHTNDDLLETIGNIISTGCIYDKYGGSAMTDALTSLFKVPDSVRHALVIKIFVLYVNPSIDKSLISNKNIPYLTVLDLIDDITDEEKKIVLNIIKIKIILRMKHIQGRFLDIPYVINNIQILRQIIIKLSNVYEKLEKLLNIIGDDDSTFVEEIRFIISGVLNIRKIKSENEDELNRHVRELLDSLIGYTSFKYNKIVFSKYKDFTQSIFSEDFDPSSLDDLNRIINPILFTTPNPEILNIFFSEFILDDTHIIDELIKSENPQDRRAIVKQLFKIAQDKDVSVYIKLTTKSRIINIDTEKDVDIDTLFNKTDSELNCKKEKENYTNVLSISKQFFESTVLTPLVTPYFKELPIKFSGYAIESGFKTGPTKQIIYNYSELMNYIIKFNETTSTITYNTPIWAKNNEKIFYTFLTHYIITDLTLQASKLNFYLKFNMLVPCLIEAMNTYKNTLYFKKLRIFKEFNKFMNIKDVKALFYNDDNSKKFENIPEDYDVYYISICLFMIGDLIDGGSEYKHFEYNIDPESEYLQTKLETFTPPSGFFDLNSFTTFPFFITDSLQVVDKIFTFMTQFYVILNENKNISAKLFISKIIFENDYHQKYSVIFDYMKQLITDYTVNLSEEMVKSLKEEYNTQEIFNEKLLLAWTASLNITKDTKITLSVHDEPDFHIYTCFNTMVYPVPRGDYVEISYEQFVNTIIGSISGIGFGRKGGRKTIKKYKHQKSIRNIRKKKKSSIKHKKKKRRTIKKREEL